MNYGGTFLSHIHQKKNGQFDLAICITGTFQFFILRARIRIRYYNTISSYHIVRQVFISYLNISNENISTTEQQFHCSMTDKLNHIPLITESMELYTNIFGYSNAISIDS